MANLAVCKSPPITYWNISLVHILIVLSFNAAIVHAPWPSGRTPVLLNLGTMFDSLAKEAIFSLWPALLSPGFPDASDPTGNIEHFGLVGSWGKCHRSSSGVTARAHWMHITNDHSLLSSTVYLVVNCHGSGLSGFEVAIHPHYGWRGASLRRRNSRPLPVFLAWVCAGAGGGRRRHTIFHVKISVWKAGLFIP